MFITSFGEQNITYKCCSNFLIHLSTHGYECEPQLGVAGYFLDLAVKNPSNPEEYLLAVECDGATYHSAKSSRDRDRLRQQILESLGWKVHRIWSTDWFKNSQEQMQILLEKLSNLIPIVDKKIADLDMKLSKTSVPDNQYTLVFDNASDDLVDFIEVNDLVKYVDNRYPEKLISVKISNNFNNYQEGITHSNSPLGLILLGLTIGESSVLSLPSGDGVITVKDIVKS